jgi:hypothetical protein
MSSFRRRYFGSGIGWITFRTGGGRLPIRLMNADKPELRCGREERESELAHRRRRAAVAADTVVHVQLAAGDDGLLRVR